MGITLLCSDDIKEKPFHFMVITTVACVLCSCATAAAVASGVEIKKKNKKKY